jgi:anti-sigma28 factor (negative regulator of flagellin synthesis)
MSAIDGVGRNTPIQKLTNQPIQKNLSADAPRQLPSTDRVELSGISHMLEALKANDIRSDKVAEIKAAIEAGTYETDEKLDVATDRLLDDLLR